MALSWHASNMIAGFDIFNHKDNSILGLNPLRAACVSGRLGNYRGNTIQIRRHSDNAVFNIGTVDSGHTDIAAINSLVGTGKASIKTIYAQDGSGVNYTQNTDLLQPIVWDNGAILQNGLLAAKFDTVYHELDYTLPSGSIYSFFDVITWNAGQSLYRYGGLFGYNYVADNGSGVSAYSGYTQGTTYKNGSTVTATTRDNVYDNIAIGSQMILSDVGFTPSSGNWSNNFTLGGYGNYGYGFNFNGYFQASIIFSGSPTNLTEIHDKLKAYFRM